MASYFPTIFNDTPTRNVKPSNLSETSISRVETPDKIDLKNVEIISNGILRTQDFSLQPVQEHIPNVIICARKAGEQNGVQRKLDAEVIRENSQPQENRVLYLSLIPKDVNRENIINLLSIFGEIEDLFIKSSKKMGAYSYGFLTYKNVESAEKCLLEDRLCINGNKVKVKRYTGSIRQMDPIPQKKQSSQEQMKKQPPQKPSATKKMNQDRRVSYNAFKKTHPLDFREDRWMRTGRLVLAPRILQEVEMNLIEYSGNVMIRKPATQKSAIELM